MGKSEGKCQCQCQYEKNRAPCGVTSDAGGYDFRSYHASLASFTDTDTSSVAVGEVIAFDFHELDQVIEGITGEKTGAQRQRSRLYDLGSPLYQ
jgi:hypothetical protein